MSRTRIVKGKIFEAVEQDYTIYSESDIIDSSAEIVSEKGAEKGVSYGNASHPPAGIIQAKCLVQFRPHAKWSGEFGFDWLRIGDTGTKGDTWYKNITGQYDINYNFVKKSSVYQKLINKFYAMSIPWKPKINGNPYLYLIPYMTIYKGMTNKLTLKVEIEELPKKLIIRHKKSPNDKDTYFKFNISEITIKKGKYTLDNYLEITCLKELRTDQIIEVIADDVVCGKLKILANSSAHQKQGKVLFITVISQTGKGSTTGEISRLNKYLKQAYINVNVKSININLSNDRNFIPKLRSGIGIHQYLDAKLRTAKFPDGSVVGNKYDSFYKVYFISEVIQQSDGSYLLGEAENIPSKTVYVLNLKDTATAAGVGFESVKTTATHELLHAIGLYHTFDNSSPITLKSLKQIILWTITLT
ncbi:hypothetical protein ACFOEQ_23850 [Chryseobacterium arachidis]|uniref:hypothetical protein n=1 Tax=Chryseobacterium arachidis TaxID=1416778 RepID=UPI00360EF1D4